MELIVAFALCVVCFQTTTSHPKPILYGGGRPNEPALGQVPYQCNLMLLNKMDGLFYSFCSGSLIHPSWVLTAAHCAQNNGTTLDDDLFVVTYGSIHTNSDGSFYSLVEDIIVHPNHNKPQQPTWRHDVALFRLEFPAMLSDFIKPIKLHTNVKQNLVGKTAFATGYGSMSDVIQYPQFLRKGVFHIARNNRCFGPKQLGQYELCATNKLEEGKICWGDGGAPLVMIEKGKKIQIGVTSHATILNVCSMEDNNSVFVKVSAYIPWISEVTGINFMKYLG